MMNRVFKNPLLLILFLTLIPAAILMLLLSNSPVYSFYTFFTGPFSNSYTFFNMINKTSPLILSSLGAFIALKSNCINLGGEGQVYLGATLTGVILIKFNNSTSYPLLLATILVVLILTGFMTFISAYLEDRYGVSSLISTYLLSMGVIHICNYIISGPYLMEGSNILSTEKIPQIFHYSSGLIPALIITAIFYLMLKHSIWGYEFKISGRNPVFAKSMGIKERRYKIAGLTLSGSLHGAAGILLVLASHHSVIYGFHNGLGWNGLSSALIAGNNPLLVILTSLFYSYLDTGASYATITSDLTLEVSDIVKSILFFVISSRILKEHLIKRSSK